MGAPNVLQEHLLLSGQALHTARDNDEQVVDGPVVSLCSPALLPSEGEAGPKESCDKRINTALRRNFKALSQSFRLSVANSIFS